jgi:TRAP-type mannitol/chloroaromatic compound transport system permease small subunit
MQGICRFVDRLNTITGAVAAWLIVPLVFAICFEVTARYLFNAPTSWSYELGYILTGAGWLLGLAYTQLKGAHIRIDVFYGRFSERRKALIEVLGHVVFTLPFLLWLCWVLDERMLAAIKSGERTGQSGWNPPIWPFRAVFFVSFVLLTLQIVADVLRKIPVLAGREPTRAVTG